MKTITTTREYDEQGRLVKETVMETVTPDAPIFPHTPACTCNSSTYCAMHHGYIGWWQQTWTCDTSAPYTTTTKAVLS